MLVVSCKNNMKLILITLFTLFFSLAASASESLCPPLPPLPKEVDDLRMTEADITKERFLNSLSYFQNVLPEILKKSKETRELTDRAEFWVSYRNGLKLIKGYMLKQEALLKGGVAKKAFCEFISGADYVD